MLRMNRSTKIIVGLSGGVDSAVSALLLKQQGYYVEGIFMQNWEVENDDPNCTAQQDLSDAAAICKHLEIPFHSINFSKEYWDNVFQYCLDEYARGRTPNPDIWCNKEIKFKVFLEYALKLGADYLATGHYVQKRETNSGFEMLRGKDSAKDQSYFLYTLGQRELSKSLFPIGHLEKTVVREIAEKNGLHNFNKKDSTGICFVGERKFKAFLQEFLLTQPGEMVTPNGNVIGRHDGLMFYTLGQRKGLNIGGQKGSIEAPWYVINKDIPQNKLIVAQGHDHPQLYSHELHCEQLHWVNDEAPKSHLTLTAKIRYRHQDEACQLHLNEHGQFQVKFNEAQWAITPGQSVVFYHNEVCLGGGIIQSI